MITKYYWRQTLYVFAGFLFCPLYMWFLCMHVCMHVCCMHEYGCVHASVGTCRGRKRTLGVFLYCSSPYCLETESLTEQSWSSWRGWLASTLPPGIGLLLPPNDAGLIGTHHQAWLLVLMGVEDSNSGPAWTYPPICLPRSDLLDFFFMFVIFIICILFSLPLILK